MSSNKRGDPQHPDKATCEVPAATPADAVATTLKKNPSPRRCRDFIRRQTATAMPNIVETFVDKAMSGSVPHFNALAKIGGFDQRSAATEAPKRRRRSLARQLLDEVEEYEARKAAEHAAAIPPLDTPMTDNATPQEKP